MKPTHEQMMDGLDEIIEWTTEDIEFLREFDRQEKLLKKQREHALAIELEAKSA